MRDWADRTALVTGASRGIGRATAIALAEAGARTALFARSGSDLESTARACRKAGGTQPLVLPVDVTDADKLSAATATAMETFGARLDLLANVAGGHLRMERFTEMTDDDWSASFDLHVMAPVRLSRSCFEGLRATQGAVVNIGSLAAIRGVPHGAAYAAMKAALASVTRTMAVEWARFGIRANTIEPGLVDTDFYDKERDAMIVERVLARVPTAAAVTPEAVARLILQLGSPENRDITGTVVRIDGGMSVKL